MTEQIKHTPGPWKCRPSEASDCSYLVFSSKGTELSRFDDERDANARLIAAAPDLLEALTRLEGTARILPRHMDVPDSALAQSVAAIAKATGAA